MYRKILVPLDASDLAECSLVHVKAIAKGLQVPEVVLLSVMEPVNPAVIGQANIGILRDAEKQVREVAEAYLAEVADDLKEAGVAAQGVVLSGRPDEEILDYVSKNQVDLIIMSTHGRSGVTRWLFGSVADRVIHHASVPVMVVSPAGCRVG